MSSLNHTMAEILTHGLNAMQPSTVDAHWHCCCCCDQPFVCRCSTPNEKLICLSCDGEEAKEI